MSEARGSPATGGKNTRAETTRRDASRTPAKHSRKGTSGAATSVLVKTPTPLPAQEKAEPGATALAVQTPAACPALAASAQSSEETDRASVPSVADLMNMICRDPTRRKKRLKFAEALRECGLDESRIADFLQGLAEKLSRNKDEGAVGVSAAKLLLDVLKELAHALEPQKTAGGDWGEIPPLIRMVHNVPRPVHSD